VEGHRGNQSRGELCRQTPRQRKGGGAATKKKATGKKRGGFRKGALAGYRETDESKFRTMLKAAKGKSDPDQNSF